MRFLTIWMLLLTTRLCLAQQGGTVYGKTSIEHHGWGLNVSISGVPEEGKLFSGTNVEIGVAALAHPLNGNNAPDRWTEANIVTFTVTIGGESITNPSEPVGPVYSYGITFSSTHFPDGNTLVPIKVKVKFQGTFADTETTDFKEVEVIVKFKSYNKGALLATSINIPDGSDPNLPSGGQGDAAKDACNKVGAQLEAMNHTVKPKGGNLPNFDGAQSLAKSALLDLIAESTVFFACTHGFLTAIEDSFGTAITWQELQDKAISNRTNGAPPFNLVFFAACSTAAANAGSGENAAGSFWTGQPITWKDRAWLGFNLPLLVGERTSNISSYCDRFFGFLKDGMTVDEAREKTGFARGGRGSTTRPVLVGDKKTTLTTVYDGVITKWYRVYFP